MEAFINLHSTHDLCLEAAPMKIPQLAEKKVLGRWADVAHQLE